MKKLIPNIRNLTRRDFLRSSAVAAAAFALPTIVPASALAVNAPGERITIGCIGMILTPF
jgi:myo-inositol 2-dehydrogenase/D-chiro-inositol 1-dehydrogenase